MLRYSRSVHMLHNVTKNNIDLFEVHLYVSTSKFMYRRASTDDHTYVHFRNTKLLKEKAGYINKKGFNSLKIGPFKYACT